MAVTNVTPVVLVLDTPSASTTDAAGGAVAATPADGWDVDVHAYKSNRILLKFFGDASGDTAYITAGDNPPAPRAGLGNITVTLAANEVKYVAVETARVMQSDGKIHAYCADAGTRLTCFILPLGF